MKTIKARIHGAVYDSNIDGIVLLLIDDDNEEHKHIMYSNEFMFKEDMDKAFEMEKLASLMEGKRINYCHDEDLDQTKKHIVKEMIDNTKRAQND